MKPFRFNSGIAVLALILGSSSAISQSSLKIPRTSDEMRGLLEEVDNRCSTCGVVTNITELRGADSDNSLNTTHLAPDAGPGPGVKPSPIISSGSSVPSTSRWRITVRYDNGQYAAFEQLDPPAVAKGDNIRVIADRVEFR